ncbi:MAG: hypothetical protein GF317_04805 [Candidatus Lokiarchaeota archaeon]|nr:hypothetical protein [Candidatus Lokiarchaeota archaeon]
MNNNDNEKLLFEFLNYLIQTGFFGEVTIKFRSGEFYSINKTSETFNVDAVKEKMKAYRKITKKVTL